ILAVAMALFAVANLLVYFHIAAGTRAHRLIFGGVVLETGLIAAFHGSWFVIALIVVGVALLVTGVMYHAAVAVSRWRPPLATLFDDRPPQIALAEDPNLDLTVVLPSSNAGPAI